MLSTFKENQVIKIVPQDAEAACSLIVTDSCEDFLIVTKLISSNKEITGKVECFTMADEGIIYFKSKISKIDDVQYKLPLPISHQVLQRREYTRIEFNSNIILKTDDNQEIEALVTDLSAGGMKLISKKELSISTDYHFVLKYDKTQEIKAVFSPIREDKNTDGTYVISGKFKNITNKDRISLAQFCFRKHMENTNK